MINVTLKSHDNYLGLASRMHLKIWNKRQPLFVEHLIFVSNVLGAGNKEWTNWPNIPALV